MSQNVLTACGFDLKFQYVLPGSEGRATDAQILHNALSRTDPLVVPPGMRPNTYKSCLVIRTWSKNVDCNHFIIISIGLGRYYLVDVGFANALGFLAPYRGVRYHLKDHSRQTLDNANELFNKRHSQAWNVIERAFGLLKGRFKILRTTL